MASDPYKELGVSRGASADEIKKAFRKLAKDLHPDTNPGDAAKLERFQRVTAAFDLLGDPEKRKKYDAGQIDADGNEQFRGFGGGRRHPRQRGGLAGDEEALGERHRLWPGTQPFDIDTDAHAVAQCDQQHRATVAPVDVGAGRMTVDPQRRAAARIARQVQRGVGTVEFEGQPGAHERLGRLAAMVVAPGAAHRAGTQTAVFAEHRTWHATGRPA